MKYLFTMFVAVASRVMWDGTLFLGETGWDRDEKILPVFETRKEAQEFLVKQLMQESELFHLKMLCEDEYPDYLEDDHIKEEILNDTEIMLKLFKRVGKEDPDHPFEFEIFELKITHFVL